jgi:hypothetical protein
MLIHIFLSPLVQKVAGWNPSGSSLAVLWCTFIWPKKVLNSCEKCIEMHDFTIEIGIYHDKIKCKFSVYRCIDITVNTTVI